MVGLPVWLYRNRIRLGFCSTYKIRVTLARIGGFQYRENLDYDRLYSKDDFFLHPRGYVQPFNELKIKVRYSSPNSVLRKFHMLPSFDYIKVEPKRLIDSLRSFQKK